VFEEQRLRFRCEPLGRAKNGEPMNATTRQVQEEGNSMKHNRYWKNPVHQKAAKEVFLPLSQKILFYDFTSE
jgi:hypothetical protein